MKKVAPDAILLALANSDMVKAAQDVGIKVAQETFADRAYNPDGTLVPAPYQVQSYTTQRKPLSAH